MKDLFGSIFLISLLFQGHLASYLKINVTIPLKIKNDDYIFDNILSKIKPNWKRHDLRSHIFTQGLTNSMSKYWVENDNSIMVRINGEKTENLIDRQQELKNWDFLAEHNAACEIYAIFNNGIVFEFIDGKTINLNEIRNPKIYPLIAREMARVHWSTQPNVQKHYNLTDYQYQNNLPYWAFTSKKWVKMIENDVYSRNPYAKSNILPEKYNRSPNKWIKKEVNQTLQEIKDFFKKSQESNSENQHKLNNYSIFFPLKRVFTHHDLLGNNMLYNKNLNKVTFIDFEYSGLDDPGWDLANHFNEYVGLDIFDHQMYDDYFPGQDLIEKFVEHYVDEAYKISKIEIENGPYNFEQEQDVKNLIQLIDLYVESSHLLWGIWSNLEVNLKGESHENGFDYKGYGKLRLEQYWIRKQKRLAQK